MLPLQAVNLTVAEVDPPASRYCASGHTAPVTFRREGANTPELPTRFFQITAVDRPAVNGIYCEPCLMIANALADKKKKKERSR
jgi:hypothetical protein